MVLQKPQEQTDRLPPPRTLIMDFTLTHTCFGRSNLHSIGQLTHTRRTDGAPEPDGALKSVTRDKIHHYRLTVDTSDRRETSVLGNELRRNNVNCCLL